MARHSNRRTSYRFHATKPSFAELVVAGRVWPVEINDESAGGHGVSSLEPLEVNQGEPAELHTASGWFEVRIVRVEQTGDRTVLGLQRLGELSVVIDSDPGVIQQVFALLIPSINSAQIVSLVLGVTLAVAVAIGAIVLTKWHSAAKSPLGRGEFLPNTKTPMPLIAEAKAPEAAATTAPSEAASTYAARTLRAFTAADFLDRKTILRLAVSPDQEKQIRALVQSLSDTIATLPLSDPEAAPLIDGLRQILTERQQAELNIEPPQKTTGVVQSVDAANGGRQPRQH